MGIRTRTRKRKYLKLKNLISGLLSGGSLLLLIAMLLWPEQTYQGALYGLELWATILVPSLFPFFIIAEILLNIGIVHFFGVLLEPFMRPLFNLPGVASFVVAMGFTSGFPMGAVLTKRLYEEKQCTVAEAERLVAFTNNSSPLFILMAVAVGMFHNPFLGIILAISHYLANLIIGIMLGLRAPRQPELYPFDKDLLRRSIQSLVEVQKKRPPWAQLMSNAIKAGINNICLIGGFVVIFAIIINLLRVTALQNLMAFPCRIILGILGLTLELDSALATGFWEMTLGLKNISLASASWQDKAILASIILGWSGLSIQAQVASVLAGSGISLRLYYLSRILQGCLAGIITYLLTLNKLLLTTPVYNQVPIPLSGFSFFGAYFLMTCRLFNYALLTLIFLSFLCLIYNYISRIFHAKPSANR